MRSTNNEVADIVSQFLPQLDGIPMHHRKTLEAIKRCRTAELGGHIDQCDGCGHLRISYNSCRNRHCPKCQGLNKEMWIIAQEDMILPVAYFHVVFTLPHELNKLCMYNPRKMYDLLFKAAWHTLNTLSSDPKWMGARSAATMILHTWSQNLSLHPHLHCIVPNGGLTKDDQWIYPKRGKSNFLYPVVAMKKIYKGFFMQNMRRMINADELEIPTEYFENYKGKSRWRMILYDKEWVVFTKKPFSTSKHVIDYLGRYSHRIAITNRRILSIDEHNVSFQYKDYRDGAKKKVMPLSGKEFLRRFCLHILPPRYRKIRHYGFISNSCKAKKIAIARRALGLKHQQLLTKSERKQKALERLFGINDIHKCPCCKKGIMKMICPFEKNRPPPIALINKIRNQNNNK